MFLIHEKTYKNDSNSKISTRSLIKHECKIMYAHFHGTTPNVLACQLALPPAIIYRFYVGHTEGLRNRMRMFLSLQWHTHTHTHTQIQIAFRDGLVGALALMNLSFACDPSTAGRWWSLSHAATIIWLAWLSFYSARVCVWGASKQAKIKTHFARVFTNRLQQPPSLSCWVNNRRFNRGRAPPFKQAAGWKESVLCVSASVLESGFGLFKTPALRWCKRLVLK